MKYRNGHVDQVTNLEQYEKCMDNNQFINRPEHRSPSRHNKAEQSEINGTQWDLLSSEMSYIYRHRTFGGLFCINFLERPLPWRRRLQAHTKRWCIHCPIFRVVHHSENGGKKLLLNERQKFKPSVQTSDLVASSSSMHGWSTNHWITWAIFFRDMLKSAFLLQKGIGTFLSISASAGYNFCEVS